MGMLYYGSATSPVHIDDELLAHLKVLMMTKLRRGESFTMTWRHDATSPPGRSTIWLAPSIALRLTFDDAEPCALDPRLLRELAEGVARTGSLILPDLCTPAPAVSPRPSLPVRLVRSEVVGVTPR